MAITQISKIQIRRGFSYELGNLAAGEFGWAIDTQRLYIGNGTIGEGAPIGGLTEILTSNADINDFVAAYIYKGLLGGYEVITGPSASDPIERSIQDKLDDFANVRDFGAIGDGIVDDYSAIQRCLDEIYDRNNGITRQRTRRSIRINGGTYRITQPLRIPPYTTIIGEGTENVIIVQDGDDAPFIAQLATNKGTFPNQFTSAPYTDPRSIYIKGLTFRTSLPIDGLVITDSTHVTFENVNFSGPTTTLTSTNTDISTVATKLSVGNRTSSQVYNVKFVNCGFVNFDAASDIRTEKDKLVQVLFDGCRFENQFASVVSSYTGTGTNSLPQSIRITNCIFRNIYSSAIIGGEGVQGHISLGNSFLNVGNAIEGSALYPVIVFSADNNYSIGDIFSRTLDESALVPRVSFGNYSVLTSAVDDGLGIGLSYFSPGRAVQISSGAEVIIPIPRRYSEFGFINYSINYLSMRRTGKISYSNNINNNSQPVVFEEDYTENTEIPATIRFIKSANSLSLGCTIDGVSIGGTPARLVYDFKTLQ